MRKIVPILMKNQVKKKFRECMKLLKGKGLYGETDFLHNNNKKLNLRFKNKLFTSNK